MSQFFDDSSTTMGDAAAGIPAPAAASARPDPRRANLLRLVPLDWDGDAVELALDAAPRPLSAEELAGAVPTVFSDRPYRIECSGPMLMRLAAVTLDLNDELGHILDCANVMCFDDNSKPFEEALKSADEPEEIIALFNQVTLRKL